MKYIFSLIIIAFLFSSCEITKRRYTSGYSVEWRHKTPKTIANRETVAANTLVSNKQNVINSSPEVVSITNTIQNISELKAPAKVVYASFASNIITPHTSYTQTSKTSPLPSDTLQKKKSKPVFFTGDEQEDYIAGRSLKFGICSLVIPALGFLTMWAIALSLGETLANAATYAIAIFIGSCAVGLIFGVLAIIIGLSAIREINSESDTYTGTGQAVTGILLGSISILGALAYLLIRFL